MFAEKTELNLIEENAIVELNADDVDEVSGAIAPVVIAAVKIFGAVGGTAAVGAGVGYVIGYWANRK